MLAEHQISIASVIQHEAPDEREGERVQLVIMTHTATTGSFRPPSPRWTASAACAAVRVLSGRRLKTLRSGWPLVRACAVDVRRPIHSKESLHGRAHLSTPGTTANHFMDAPSPFTGRDERLLHRSFGDFGPPTAA